MNSKNLLLSGIPRSGTTLCCKLLNGLHGVTALHEPIDPQKLSSTSHNQASQEIAKQVDGLRNSLLSGKDFEHGDSKGVELDNPVGLELNDQKVRSLKARRGLTRLEKHSPDFVLVVKQNALFAALCARLSQHYSMVAIVRNPIKVLLSWMTVDLPVNKGYLPAGEKFDSNLAAVLKTDSVLQRQIQIYKWFIRKYESAGIPILRYEEIIATSGSVLFDAFGLKYEASQQKMTELNREYPKEVLSMLFKHQDTILAELCSNFYQRTDIEKSLKSLKNK